MALISCTECGKEVSTQAEACPHCGMKMPKKSVWPTVILTILAVPAAIIVATALFGESNEERDARYQVARKECIERGARAGVAASGQFGGAIEAVTLSVVKKCLADKGFELASEDGRIVVR